MKVILSRKGFDSAAGGCASPIFDDGSLFSLPILQPSPIPSADKRITFDNISFKYPIGKVVEDLTRRSKKPVKATDTTHFDPDLRAASLPRKPGWRGMFGQAGAAQAHLRNNNIDAGDLFLFFGWFREVEESFGSFRFKHGAPNRHIFFGWLEIGEKRELGIKRENIPAWADMHPHITSEFNPSNTLYVARDKPGSAGVFPKVQDSLVLTTQGSFRRSDWCLPGWFHPQGKKSCLSYHSSAKRWSLPGEHVSLSSVPRGQEFVLDCKDYPQAEGWARDLIANNAELVTR